MVLPTVQDSYDTKPRQYYQWVRPEMQECVPSECKRILDVGCGEGAFGESLKRMRGVEVYGVEPTNSAAVVASKRLDSVIQGFFGQELPIPTQYFDCIVFNDVLEHMTDPEAALRYAKTLLRPGGTVVASIPNISYLPVVRDLIFRDRWEYVDAGTLDRTHLRFFTHTSIKNMFEREGFRVATIRGINAYTYKGPSALYRTIWGMFKVTNVLFRNRFERMRFLQFAVVAHPVGIDLEEG